MTTKTKSAFILLGMLIIGVVIGVLASGTLRSEKERHYERMRPGDRFHSFIVRVIQPAEDQKEPFETIVKKHSKQLAELHQEHQQELFAIYDTLRAELDEILTEDQRKRLEEHLEKGGGKIVAMRMADLTEALGLNQDQRKQFKQIMESFKKRPPFDRKNFDGNWDDRRRIFKERFHEMQQQIEKILTEEQLQKYRQLRPQLSPPFGPPFERHFSGPHPQKRPVAQAPD